MKKGDEQFIAEAVFTLESIAGTNQVDFDRVPFKFDYEIICI